MTDTVAPTARPLNAAIAWCDATHVYIEYPVKGGGPPYITKYPKTAQGLHFAFGCLVEHPAPRSSTTADHPAIQRQSKVTASQLARDEAAALVKRLFK